MTTTLPASWLTRCTPPANLPTASHVWVWIRSAALPSLAAALLLFLVQGCRTTDVPARSLVTAVQTVDAAMQGWATFVALDKATTEQQIAVFVAYQKYQLAESAAQSALIETIGNHDAPAWTKARDALTAAQTDLLLLVDQFAKPK